MTSQQVWIQWRKKSWTSLEARVNWETLEGFSCFFQSVIERLDLTLDQLHWEGKKSRCVILSLLFDYRKPKKFYRFSDRNELTWSLTKTKFFRSLYSFIHSFTHSSLQQEENRVGSLKKFHSFEKDRLDDRQNGLLLPVQVADPAPEGGQQGGHLQAGRALQIPEGLQRPVRLQLARGGPQTPDQSPQIFQEQKIRKVVASLLFYPDSFLKFWIQNVICF